MDDQARRGGGKADGGQGPTCPLPPAQVEPFVAVLGIEGALAFLLAFGGAELAWSHDPKGGGMVERQVGVELARKLAASPAANQRRVPLAKPWVARCLCAQGETTAAIARRLHASDVSVRGWLRGFNGAGRDGWARPCRLPACPTQRPRRALRTSRPTRPIRPTPSRRPASHCGRQGNS